MNKQAMLKSQTCVLRFNIHCEGCEHKVRKKLKKIKGVEKVQIDAEQRKVTVSGNVDPRTLIEKLEKDGKHAELWGAPQKGGGPVFPNQFMKNPQSNGGGKDKLALKGGFQQKKWPKDVKVVDKRSVKFVENFSDEEEEDDDDYLDDSDYDDDEFDDAHQPHGKGAVFAGHGGNLKGNKGGNDGVKGKKGKSSPNEHSKGEKGGKDVGKKGGGGGGGIDVFLKGLLGRSGSKKEGGKKDGKKNDGFVVGEGKNGAAKANGKNGEKLEKGFDGGLKMGGKQQEMKHYASENHKGGGGDGWNKGGLGGQKGNFAADPGQFQGGGGQQGYPPQHNQQEMERMMMMAMMNQRARNGNGHDVYGGGGPIMNAPPQYGGGPMMNAPPQYGGQMMNVPPQYGAPMMYGGPMMNGPPQHQPLRYGPPPPANDGFTHMFNDENTDSCSIM